VDPGHFILDRILDGIDLAMAIVEIVQAPVEGRRFACTGRPGHQDQTMRTVEQLAQALERLVGIPQLGKARQPAAALEKAHRHVFAPKRRNGIDAQVDSPLRRQNANPSAVQRHLLLGELHARHRADVIDEVKALFARDIAQAPNDSLMPHGDPGSLPRQADKQIVCLD
jgi:hypothetical protein